MSFGLGAYWEPNDEEGKEFLPTGFPLFVAGSSFYLALEKPLTPSWSWANALTTSTRHWEEDIKLSYSENVRLFLQSSTRVSRSNFF